MRDEIDRFTDLNVRPFGVNPATAREHADYVRHLELPFPLLSDAGGAIARAYGVLNADGTVPLRAVVRIDRDGRIGFAALGAPPAYISLEGLSPSPPNK